MKILVDIEVLEQAIKTLNDFTRAIDSALWIALMWNDHNHDTETMLYKAEMSARSLGLKRGGPDNREEVFARWNNVITNLRAALEANEQLADKEDAERLDWLESNPRHAEVLIDGISTGCVFYGISCSELVKLREAIDAARAAEKK